MLAVLGALSSFGPLSMDMYLPSTPTIAANLHASQTLVQLTLSGCLAGLAVGQPWGGDGQPDRAATWRTAHYRGALTGPNILSDGNF